MFGHVSINKYVCVSIFSYRCNSVILGVCPCVDCKILSAGDILLEHDFSVWREAYAVLQLVIWCTPSEHLMISSSAPDLPLLYLFSPPLLPIDAPNSCLTSVQASANMSKDISAFICSQYCVSADYRIFYKSRQCWSSQSNIWSNLRNNTLVFSVKCFTPVIYYTTHMATYLGEYQQLNSW